jgi:hypothetical protein
MSFLVSPGVHVKEIDLTNVVPSVDTTIGAIAGPFEKGPVSSIVTITSESDLLNNFGKPNASNFEWWYTASNFLKYSNTLKVVRAESALLNASEGGTGLLIRDNDQYLTDYFSETGDGTVTTNDWYARTAGTNGNSIGVEVCPSAQAYEQDLGSNNLVNGAGAVGDKTITVDDADEAGFAFQVGDMIKFHEAFSVTKVVAGAVTASINLTVDGGSGTVAVGHRVIGAGITEIVKVKTVTSGTVFVLDKAITVADDVVLAFSDYASIESGDTQYEVTSISGEVLSIRLKDDPDEGGLQTIIPDNALITRRWRWADLFNSAPGQSAYNLANGRGTGDELHIVFFDTTGLITGSDVDVAGQRGNAVLETYANLSKNSSAKGPQGDSIYYPTVIFNQSEFVFWGDHIAAGTNWGTDTATAYTSVVPITTVGLAGGTDDYSVTAGELELAYDKFGDAEGVDVNLVLGGPSSGVTDSAAGQDTHVTMITSLVEGRKDCVGFVSPYRSATVGIANTTTQTENVTSAFELCPSSSYMVFDSGHKYMYDKYNDVYRYIPLNGDIAGLCARTDGVADPWFSPAGYNRGNIRGAIKLSYNPSQGERDQLYRFRVNPVVNFPGQGVVLFGDKTALSKPSAFDRINVRRLFLVLEKAIATASKFQLFEFNDEFTRAQFRNLVEPFLRDVQGRRGITDFKVVADATNNTGEVIDRNEFIGDIYIKPARAINFITLNFIATRTGVAFSEVGG